MQNPAEKSQSDVSEKLKGSGKKDRTETPRSEASHTRSKKKELGYRGETAACAYLERCGVEILERNWRCKAGEADIIAYDDGEIVFIEVKTRASASAGLPEDAVNLQKRKKYENIALYYLSQSDIESSRIRFDVISLTLMGDNRAFLRHHRDAFCVED